MRSLNKAEIQARFDRRNKLHDFEVDALFDVKNLKPIQYRYLEKGVRYQWIWDIETSDFNPLGNFIIGYCGIMRDILTGKTENYEDNITKKDIKTAVENDSFDFDRRLLQTLGWNIKQCDQAVGHYSTKFDMPFFRTRCLLTEQYDLIPDYSEVTQGDTWRYMKTSMKAPRNTLMNLSLYTKTPNQKTHVSMEHWKRIYFSSNPKWEKSMNYIMDHCRKDVAMTLRAVKKIEGFNNIGRTLV